MARRLIEHDPLTHQSVWHHYDHETRTTTIETVQDVAPYLRVTQAERNRGVGGAKGLNDISRKQIKDGWWHVARIPVTVQHYWLKTYGVDIYNKHHQDRVRKLLNDPDWAYLRSNPGKV